MPATYLSTTCACSCVPSQAQHDAALPRNQLGANNRPWSRDRPAASQWLLDLPPRRPDDAPQFGDPFSRLALASPVSLCKDRSFFVRQTLALMAGDEQDAPGQPAIPPKRRGSPRDSYRSEPGACVDERRHVCLSADFGRWRPFRLIGGAESRRVPSWGCPGGRNGQIGAQVRRHVVRDPPEA